MAAELSKVSGAGVSYAHRSNRLKKGGRVRPFSYYEARNVYCILLLLDDRGEKVSVFKVGFYWIAKMIFRIRVLMMNII